MPELIVQILMPDAERIKLYREENGCGLLEARNQILRHQIEDALSYAESVDDLKLIIQRMMRLL